MTKFKESIAKKWAQIQAQAHKQQKQTGAMKRARQEHYFDENWSFLAILMAKIWKPGPLGTKHDKFVNRALADRNDGDVNLRPKNYAKIADNYEIQRLGLPQLSRFINGFT